MLMSKKLLGFMLLWGGIIGLTKASPLARFHMRIVQPPHVQEHGLTTDGARVIEQHSYVSIGRSKSQVDSQFENKNYENNLDTSSIQYAEEGDSNFGVLEQANQNLDFANQFDYTDPLLLTGRAAMMAIKYLYGRGEFFFKDIPHERALMINQELRQNNGLAGNLLSSLRPNSPWYRHDN